MILGLVALKQRLDSAIAEPFDGSSSSEASNDLVSLLVIIILFVLYLIIYAYGAARLSYFYNMNNGSPGYALFFSILAFLFADFYYPMYSYFLNPQSAKGRNNISLPSM
jgi:biotin transporter BioY